MALKIDDTTAFLVPSLADLTILFRRPLWYSTTDSNLAIYRQQFDEFKYYF
jgi:hypothetical protein